ncbi:MAG: hypothetical protein ACRD5J_00365 [Nitrososphaeraceae archaeon]
MYELQNHFLVISGLSNGMTGTLQQKPPDISIRSNLWILIPIITLIVAILSANLLLLSYVHVFTAILWTGTDIFMVFLLGPVLRNVNLLARKEVISWLMPKMVFYMPTVAAVTTTAGYFLASELGLITLNPPIGYWISAVLAIVSVMFILGLGVLLPTNLRIYFEMKKNMPEMPRIQKLMKRYVKVVAVQTMLQFIIIFIMAEFATGYFLNL